MAKQHRSFVIAPDWDAFCKTNPDIVLPDPDPAVPMVLHTYPHKVFADVFAAVTKVDDGKVGFYRYNERTRRFERTRCLWTVERFRNFWDLDRGVFGKD